VSVTYGTLAHTVPHGATTLPADPRALLFADYCPRFLAGGGPASRARPFVRIHSSRIFLYGNSILHARLNCTFGVGWPNIPVLIHISAHIAIRGRMIPRWNRGTHIFPKKCFFTLVHNYLFLSFCDMSFYIQTYPL
jgi:hypothetical protein